MRLVATLQKISSYKYRVMELMLAHLTIIILVGREVVLHVDLLFAQERYVTHWLTNRLLPQLLLSLVSLVLVSSHLLLACWTQMRSLVGDDVGCDNAQTSTLVPIIW